MATAPVPIPPYGPFDVALHWPYVRRNLHLARRRPWQRALDLLAEEQVAAEGNPVPLGRSRWRAAGMTPGEGGAAYNALVALEGRGVVVRYRGSGRRADAWSLRPEVGRWRSMPWGVAGRDVEGAVRACACATFRAVAARNPGQSVAPRRPFWLGAEDHLRPPGLFLVDSRVNGDSRAAAAQRPGRTLVDTRGNERRSDDPLLSIDEDFRLHRLNDDDERIAMLREGVRAAGVGNLFGEPLRALAALAAGLTVDQAAAVARELPGACRLGDGTRLRSPARIVERAAELAAAPAVRAMAEG